MANPQLTKFFTDLHTIEDRRDKAEADIAADIAFLTETITKLNNVPGTFTPEEQALVDAALARLSGSADRAEALSNLTTPTPPGGSGDGAPVP